MKYIICYLRSFDGSVAPCAGAWIEIAMHLEQWQAVHIVAPCAGAWIEIPPPYLLCSVVKVAPCAGAWIEIRILHDRAD